MAITIDYSNPPQYVIKIPRADMALVQASPEIRSLDLDQFRLQLADIQDNSPDVWSPTSFNHIAPITVSGVQLARVVEILDPYVIEFEDDLYNVNIVGGNSNVSDKSIKNQVGVNTANSAGLTFSTQINEQSFAGYVWINTVNGLSGTSFPRGTPTDPVDNWDDADVIADTLRLERFKLAHMIIMPVAENLDGYTIEGLNPVGSQIGFQGGSCMNMSLSNLSFGGLMGEGFFSARECVLGTTMSLEAGLFECVLNGNIQLDATPVGPADISFMNCVSGFPGNTPFVLDCNGTTADIQFRNWSGGMQIQNFTNSFMSIDMAQGKVILDASCTGGQILLRGLGELEDNSGAGCTVIRTGLLTPDDVALARDHARAANMQTKGNI